MIFMASEYLSQNTFIIVVILTYHHKIFDVFPFAPSGWWSLIPFFLSVSYT